MIRKKKLGICLGALSILLILIDQISKALAVKFLKGDDSIILIKNVISFRFLDGGNQGAAWGILSGKRIFLILFSAVIILLIIKFLYNTINIINPGADRWLMVIAICFSVLIAGAAGNLIDRITRGSVIDFISFDFFEFPIFNFADCCVSISCVVLIIACIFGIKDNEQFTSVFKLRK